MLQEVVERLREQYKNDDAEEQRAGRKAGADWAIKQASPLQMLALECVRRKPVSDTKFLHTVLANRSTKHSEQKPPSFEVLFGEHIRSDRPYTSVFLRAFVAGALDIWDQVKNQVLNG